MGEEFLLEKLSKHRPGHTKENEIVMEKSYPDSRCFPDRKVA